MSEQANSSVGPERAVRLICTIDDGQVRVMSRRRLTKVVPPSEPLAGGDVAAGHGGGDAPRSGFWVELRDNRGQVRYRRVVADPLAGEVEVPGEEGSFTWRSSPAASTAFAVLVPDVPDADHVALVRGGTTSAEAARTSALAALTGEVARLPLRDATA